MLFLLLVLLLIVGLLVARINPAASDAARSLTIAPQAAPGGCFHPPPGTGAHAPLPLASRHACC